MAIDTARNEKKKTPLTWMRKEDGGMKKWQGCMEEQKKRKIGNTGIKNNVQKEKNKREGKHTHRHMYISIQNGLIWWHMNCCGLFNANSSLYKYIIYIYLYIYIYIYIYTHFWNLEVISADFFPVRKASSEIFIINGFQTIIFIVISQCFGRYNLLPSSDVYRTREPSRNFELPSFIESMGVVCSDSISHSRVQVLSIPVLLLTCSQD